MSSTSVALYIYIYRRECDQREEAKAKSSLVTYLTKWSIATGKLFSGKVTMPKVHPKAEPILFDGRTPDKRDAARHPPVAALTVWRKSLLLTCSGFTVFDGKGNLVYRVDNYASDSRREVVLMDATGKSLITVRRKQKLSMGGQWMIYSGGVTTDHVHLFSFKKHMSFRHSKRLAQVTIGSGGRGVSGELAYEIEGSYGRRSCVIYNDKREVAAEILRKESVGGASFGDEVFRLVVQPEIDCSVAMALVVVLDRMCGSSSSSLS